ncbi:MAG TPA: glutathione-regulated potassium-efflux system protein KefC [Gammaproteobacteria bacterium]|nr:glutathione-regulated potassium-efflux system protein KefC [Gammaproteobacteria bacterium]
MLAALLVFLAAAAVAPPLCKKLGLGSLMGYLLVGLAIRPLVSNLGVDRELVLHVSELGVVLLLFLVGLELRPAALWEMRHRILGLGLSQYLLTALLIGVAAAFTGQPYLWLIAALAIPMSSTAMGLRELVNRRLLGTEPGRSAFAVLLLQDILVVPVLLIIGWVGAGSLMNGALIAPVALLKAFAIVIGLLVFGHYIARPLFRWVASGGEREPFVALSLGIVIGAALLADAAGLSMAFGTFLAGVLLADSEYRHEVELDLEPFKGLLLGLFFMSVGLNLDLALIRAEWLLIVGAALGALLVKGCVLAALAQATGLSGQGGRYFLVALAPIGEFSFVLTRHARDSGLITPAVAAELDAVAALSLLAGPLLFILVERLGLYHYNPVAPPSATPAPEGGAVIVVGFGRFGQVIARMLLARGYSVSIIDHDPSHVELARRFGWKTRYGDGSRLDTLRAAGLDQAEVLVLASGAPENLAETVRRVREAHPHVRILARAQSRLDAFELVELGVDFERETFRSAVALAERALVALGEAPTSARAAARAFIDHDDALLRASALHRHDQERLIALAARSRVELEELLARETTASEARP